jgi:prepilin-type N-terminal cleavage/methylation domain-containing protein/prepilin-type processing-associated H-X9-DG protein
MKRIVGIGTKTNNRSPAFTLLEVIVVMGVIAVMTAVAYPMYTNGIEGAKAAKDLSNLHYLGIATQLYMNDNNGVFPGSATATWMSQLELNKKYLSTWRVLESPFDNRVKSDLGNVVSYGINANILPGNVAISADKITNPVTFIVFAPAQTCSANVAFLGNANDTVNDPAPGVTVLADLAFAPAAVCPPPNNDKVKGGTHSSRTKINAVFADWHVEPVAWSAFKDTNAPYRWSP